jgi:hypothetical protein
MRRIFLRGLFSCFDVILSSHYLFIVCIATNRSEVARNLKPNLEKYLELHKKDKLCP